MEDVLGVFTAVLIAALPMATGVTKVVDLIRNAVDPEAGLPKATWNIMAFAVGVAICLGWQFNLMEGLTNAIPALADSTRLDGIAGQVLTGLLVGGMAGFWHEKLDEWHSNALARRAMALQVTAPPPSPTKAKTTKGSA